MLSLVFALFVTLGPVQHHPVLVHGPQPYSPVTVDLRFHSPLPRPVAHPITVTVPQR
jgi:hypothetical protein